MPEHQKIKHQMFPMRFFTTFTSKDFSDKNLEILKSCWYIELKILLTACTSWVCMYFFWKDTIFDYLKPRDRVYGNTFRCLYSILLLISHRFHQISIGQDSNLHIWELIIIDNDPKWCPVSRALSHAIQFKCHE